MNVNMNFVHCNVCYRNHDQSQLLPFFVTNCGHLYCENCIEKGKSEIQCKMCRKNATIIKLDKNSPMNIQDFFSDPDTWDTKAKMIRDFQHKQTTHKFKYLEVKFGHYNQLKSDYRKLLIELQNKDKELKQLKNNIKNNCEKCGNLTTPNMGVKCSPMSDVFQKYPSPAFSMRSGNNGSVLPNKNLSRQTSPYGITQHQPASHINITRPAVVTNTNINSFRSPQHYSTQSTAMNSTMNETLSQKYNPISFLARWSGIRPNN